MSLIVAFVLAAGLNHVQFADARQTRQPTLKLDAAASNSRTGARITAAQEHSVAAGNPLLAPGGLIAFADVRLEHAVPAVESRLQDGKSRLQKMEASLQSVKAETDATVAYEQLLPPLEELYLAVGQPWEALNHLKSVRDSQPLREAVEKLQPKMVAFWQTVSQSASIYAALSRIHESSSFAKLPEARQRIVQKELLDRKLGGVGLSDEHAKAFNSVQRQLSDLSTSYSNNVLDARKSWNVTLREESRVHGIPPRALSVAAQLAQSSGLRNSTAASGPWTFTLDGTLLGPALTYAQDRGLREQLFRASATMAASGPSDNTKVVAKILELRQQEAELLGYSSYAAVSLASKMAHSEEVHRLLDDLQKAGKPAAEAEDVELADFAKQSDGITDLKSWDRGYYIEKLRQKKYGIDAEALRVYFAYPAVVDGLFSLCTRLFGVTVTPVAKDGERAKAAKWHSDVQLFDVTQDGKTIGHVLIDPYSRPAEKRAGAWVQPLATRHFEGKELQLPAAALITNFPQPQDSKPSLLSLGEVDTLFHEFGHALQHVLTLQNESAVSGLNGIEWDAVEIASQFMEYWPEFDDQTFTSFAKHYSTGEAMPADLRKQIAKARDFRAGSGMLGQIYLGKVDLRLHEKYEQGEDAMALEKGVAKDVLVVQPLAEARPLCSFSHIFAGGYAAGYYSYQWSKVLSADAFSAFEEGSGGLGDAAQVRSTGRRLAATLLGLGGGRAPGKVFEDFRGRGPKPEALLRYSGLLAGGKANTNASSSKL